MYALVLVTGTFLRSLDGVNPEEDLPQLPVDVVAAPSKFLGSNAKSFNNRPLGERFGGRVASGLNKTTGCKQKPGSTQTSYRSEFKNRKQCLHGDIDTPPHNG